LCHRYIEKEDEFDINPESTEEMLQREREREREVVVDVVSGGKAKAETGDLLFLETIIQPSPALSQYKPSAEARALRDSKKKPNEEAAAGVKHAGTKASEEQPCAKRSKSE